MRILIMGPPGVGKGTQAARVADAKDLPHISTGQILRTEVAAGTGLGNEIRHLMSGGQLVPDGTVIEIVERRLMQADCQAGWLLDGFPRTTPQARALDEFLETHDVPLTAVIHLYASDEELQARLLARAAEENRPDDTAETIARRLQVYRQQTQPLLDYYAGRGQLLHSIESKGGRDSVFQAILDVL